MVSLGGVTRLTRSGLSIVEWRPEGEALPATPAEWAVAFERYKAFPEYQRANSRMTLEEFKPIYWMEWAHRAWGRGLGLVWWTARGHTRVRRGHRGGPRGCTQQHGCGGAMKP